MDLLPALLFLLIGAALGALAMYVVAQRRDGSVLEEARREVDDARELASAARADAAAAIAKAQALESAGGTEEGRRQRDEAVLRALGPVSERLSRMQQTVSVLERDRVDQYSQLSEQLERAARLDAELLRTTTTLAGSLRDAGRRGAWGEVQLRRVVESAGMLRHVDFDEQVSAGSGRPDLVVWLPGERSIAVDAKVPLAKLLRAHAVVLDGSEAAERERAALLTEHAKALRAHVVALGSRRYQDALPGSPELVVCFVPAESVLADALEADGSLLDDAFAQGVVLASPGTLLAILKGLAVAWRQEALTQNARDLFDESRELYRRLGTLSGHLDKLGSSLKASVEGYNRFVGALQSRVLPSARRISEMHPDVVDKTGAPFQATAAVEVAPREIALGDAASGEQSATAGGTTPNNTTPSLGDDIAADGRTSSATG